MLSLVVFLPLAGALALLAVPNKDGSRDGAIRWGALAVSLASFASTLASTWLISQVERDRSLAPYAAYRVGLAGLVAGKLWKTRHR